MYTRVPYGLSSSLEPFFARSVTLFLVVHIASRKDCLLYGYIRLFELGDFRCLRCVRLS